MWHQNPIMLSPTKILYPNTQDRNIIILKKKKKKRGLEMKLEAVNQMTALIGMEIITMNPTELQPEFSGWEQKGS